MAKADPEAERKRLAEHYASITDEELRQLADDAWSLTDSAKELLKAELSRRGLAIELRDSSATEESAPGLVILRTYRDLPEALLAKSILDSAGFECFLLDENVIRMDWLLSNALGNIKLLVKTDAASEAAKFLDPEPIESFEVTASGEYKQPRCPVCDSLDVSYGVLGKRLAYLTVALGVPLPVRRSGWKCHSCGHSWDQLSDSAAADGPNS